MLFEAFIQGLLSVFSLPSFLYMLAAILFGLMIGFIPGLGGGFALAMLIPFTFAMDPGPALAFLLGGHAVVATGGSISAILFNSPGSGPNAATVLDGFPMTQRGEAGRALGAALTSSAMGGLFGAFVLALMVPVIRPVVLVFAPPEFFMLAMLGICFIALMGDGVLYKGLIAGGIGLLMSYVGYENSSGIIRYAFGQLYLHEGISLIPAVIGLFAIAEMISLAVKGGSIAQKGTDTSAKKGVLEGVKDVFRHWGLFLRSSALGTLIGIIPGLGGDAAAFLVYGQAVQTSKDKESFGKGNVKGVIAPEAANNAKEGGSLVPTLGFGVPGSSSMAIILGALLIIGLTPGPEMLTKNVDIVFQLVWTLVVANIIGAAIALTSASTLAKLTFLRGSIIIPIVLGFSFVGAFATHNSMGDVVLAVTTGLLGYFMKKLEYSRATLILGLVLGTLAEKNLTLSLRLFGSDFFMRPISLILLILIVVLLASPTIKYWLKRRKGGITS